MCGRSPRLKICIHFIDILKSKNDFLWSEGGRGGGGGKYGYESPINIDYSKQQELFHKVSINPILHTIFK